MTEKFEDILAKKEACVKRSDVKEAKKAERFNMFMTAAEKKLKLEEKKTMLEEKKVEIAAASEDSKMLTLKMDDLTEDARMIMQAVRVRMLKRLAAELETAEKEAAGEEPAAE